MDFPSQPLPPPSPHRNPPAITSLTFPPFHLLFTAQSIVIVRCSMFRFNPHSLEVSPLDRHLLPPPYICVCSSFISGSSLSLVILFGISSVIPVFAFLSRFFPACRFHVNFLHALNRSTASHPWRPLHPSFFSLPCISVEETMVTPNPVACHVLPHPSPQPPHCSHSPIRSPFSPCWLLWCGTHSPIPPSPTQFPFLSHACAHPRPPIKIRSGTQCRLLIFIRFVFSSLFSIRKSIPC